MSALKHLNSLFRKLFILLVFAATLAHSQTVTRPALPASSNSDGAASATVAAGAPDSSPELFLNGLNFRLTESLEQDSTTGWSDYLTPDLSLTVSRNLSFDVSFPWYPTLAVNQPQTVNGVTTTTLAQVHNAIGDTAVAARATGSHGDFGFSGGAAVGFATGDKSLGIGAGQTTYHLGTHAEYSIGPFTPEIEAGIGNTSTFANARVKKSYTAVGRMANFQAGSSIDLPKKVSLDVAGYEAMPLQTASVFGTIGRRGNHGHGAGKKTVQGASTSSEDNGFMLDLSFPLTRKLAFSADYQRSLIQANDIVGFSLSWVLRTPKSAEKGIAASPLSNPGN